jgi:hypothetical protein
MQRWIGIGAAVLLAVVALVVFLTSRAPAEPPGPKPVASAIKAEPTKPATTQQPVAETPAIERDQRFDKLPNGAPVPPLPSTAPKTVAFGAILFAYKGAEYAPKDAPSKEQALEKARAAVKDAQADFGEAVKKGDRGSVSDAGKIPQGVLERSVEYALFTLDKGKVHPEPVDTPRGFLVIRRND